MAIYKQCDGLSRRDALRVGVLGGGLTLGGFFRMASAEEAESHARKNATEKSAIFIELPGGPSHMDSFDLKPDAPKEFRGTFNPINTNVSGIQISEHLPKLAQVADKFAILRGVSHSLGAHPLGQKFVATGNRPTPALEYPAYGSVATKTMDAPEELPAYVAIPKARYGPGYLGVKHAALSTNAAPRAGRPFNVRGISLGGGLSLTDIEKRKSLLEDLDSKFNEIQKNDQLLDGLDEFSQKAYDMMVSKTTRNAFDVSKESESFRSQFGEDEFSQSCLLATRLIESGVRFVTVTKGGWDTHQNNFTRLKDDLLPSLDAGLSALFIGLEQKGLLETTTVYVTGEFGRTPKINSRTAEGGRDHYPRCMFMLMGGGGVAGGQVIGESDARAAAPKHEGIAPEDVAASFYHSLGIPHTQEFQTPTGRPVMIVREGKIIRQLFG